MADEIVDDRRIANYPLDESEHPFAVTSEHNVHRGFITFRKVL